MPGIPSAMRLHFLQPLYETEGPYVSVYLNVSRDAEDAPKAIGLRWRAAREDLEGQGADAATLDAVERTVGEAGGRGETPVGPQGQAVFAAGGRVVLNELLPEPPRRTIARFSPLPHAMPYAVQRDDRIAFVRVAIDRLGADIIATSSGGVERDAEIRGDDYPIHKPRGGEFANKRYQRAAEHQWQANAIDVAAEVERLALRTGAEAIVVSGDRQVARMMVDHLREGLRPLVAETESGVRADGSATAVLDAEAARLTQRKAAERAREITAAYRREAGQRDRAAEGLAATVAALRLAQAEALLLNDDPNSTAELWAGPEATHLAVTDGELHDMGVPEPFAERADAVLVRALAGTDAELHVVPPEELKLTDGVGALLRYTFGPS